MPWIAGIEREKINWGPTIDYEKCVLCGMCLNCGQGVYEWVDGKAVVARYTSCMPGCRRCGDMCLGDAISFPPVQGLRKVLKEHDVWTHVKKALVAEGKMPKKASGGPSVKEVSNDE